MKHLKNLSLLGMVLALSCLVIVATGNIAMAGVAGQCSNCHTMHYSQDANIPVGAGLTGPYPVLLLNDCIGCHSTTGTDPLDNTNHTPFIKGSLLTMSNSLAGGYLTDGGGNHDDASHTLGSDAVPAGYSRTGPDDFYQGDTATGGFSCAGATGCHGNQTSVNNDEEGIKGGHHNTAATYRMLYVDDVAVVGYGDPNYEETLISTPDITLETSTTIAHNRYSAGDTDVTISEFCGKCHGDFHQDIGTASPWIRHPTDVDIPHTGGGFSVTWEIVNADGTPSVDYTDIDRKYNPLGFADGVETTTGRATCLSCHRAHGTEYEDILRFPYSDQLAGSSTVTIGCLGCHNYQRATP
jgi:hypothetical protein